MVELFVAMFLGVVLGATLWTLVRSDQRRFFTDQGRIGGLHGAVLLDDSLSRDLRRLVLFPGPQRLGKFHVDDPVEIGDGGRSFTFLAAREATVGGGLLPTATVTYKLDGVSGHVVRESGTDRTAFPTVDAEDLVFSLVTIRPSAAAAAAPGVTFNPASSSWVLKYHLTCRAKDAPDRVLGQETTRVVLVGAVPLIYQRERALHPYWMPPRLELLALPGAP